MGLKAHQNVKTWFLNLIMCFLSARGIARLFPRETRMRVIENARLLGFALNIS